MHVCGERQLWLSLVTIFWPRLMAGDMNGEGGKGGRVTYVQ
jgi:hypothetical protein